MHTQLKFYNWDLAPCSPSHLSKHKPGGGRWRYIEKCCLPNGNYLLSCTTIRLHGWIDSFVKIGKHQFCDDYTTYNSLVKLNIPGENSYIILSMCLIFWTIIIWSNFSNNLVLNLQPWQLQTIMLQQKVIYILVTWIIYL